MPMEAAMLLAGFRPRSPQLSSSLSFYVIVRYFTDYNRSKSATDEFGRLDPHSSLIRISVQPAVICYTSETIDLRRH